MKLKDLESNYRGNIFDTISNEPLLNDTDEWVYYSSVSLNGSIAIGWLTNDDIIIINVDGIYVYDIHKKEIVSEDYETSFKKYISNDNLNYFLKSRNETINIFGLRGGGGNLLTNDSTWKIEIVHIAWNICVPKLLNYKSRDFWFLELLQNDYEGYKYLGFSKTEKYFAIMGDRGIDIYSKKGTPPAGASVSK